MSSYKLVEKGSKYTLDYAAYFYDIVSKRYVSPFHDIPLFSDVHAQILNMVVEIPRWSNAKFEINTKAKLNPIKQDVKKEKPRYVDNFFPYHGYPWNYGALPQTWEDPELVDPYTNCKGDNDPIDIIEIGSKLASTGDVLKVKVIGCIALIDEGETDWKIISINAQDPNAIRINCLNSMNEVFPGLLENTIRWFRNYKISSGSGPNAFAFEPDFVRDSMFALNVIKSGHEAWKKLVSTNDTPLSIASGMDTGSKNFVSVEESEKIVGRTQTGFPSDIPAHGTTLFVDSSRSSLYSHVLNTSILQLFFDFR
ncbi:Inorganic pyrophosphatase [Thelohanellus kitauei]|uniref:inorganic diphosphatase n=1 Tax=Thelohanellus kitauei TaxID=669202 RepID=A0A0C2IZE1_THEKT|nr:Inorganic pyrophosphatase [Thelohanellus kitauei]